MGRPKPVKRQKARNAEYYDMQRTQDDLYKRSLNNQNFIKLQDQLDRLEEEIAGSRRYYNGVVNQYNTKAEMFPGNIIAGIFKFQRKPLFEVDSESERENVTVDFS